LKTTDTKYKRKIIHIISGLGNGGAEACLFRLIIANPDYTHIVISIKDKGFYGDKLAENNIKVITLNLRNYVFIIPIMFKIKNILVNEKPDVIHSWMYLSNLIAGFIGYFLKIKNIIWSVHGSVHLPSTKISTFIIILMCSFLSWIIPNHIVFVSNYSIKRHLKLGFCKNKIRLITNGFTIKDEVNIYRNREFLEREFSILKDFKIFAMISRYHPVKDFKTLLLSLKKLKENFKNFKCLLIGHNIYQNKELEFLVNSYQLNTNVLLVGEIRDITSLMSGFDLLFLSSLSESFPNVIIEAMANGTPCISTNVGDISLIIDDETGWVIPKSDPQAFSRSILLAINEMDNKFLWNERRLKCISKIKNNYSFEKMNNNYVELWENI